MNQVLTYRSAHIRVRPSRNRFERLVMTRGTGLGRHAICEFWGAGHLNDPIRAEQALRDACAAGDLSLIELFVHQFSPHGLSAVAVIAESHLAIHTWPEYGYVAADFFTCGEHT